MTDNIFVQSFDNGMVLVAQSMPWLESAAFTLALPAGCRSDPEDRLGLSNFVCEMAQRGCGTRDSRQFVEYLDNLGVDRSAHVSSSHTSYSAAMPADKLAEALAIYADLVRRPHLPEDQLEDGRMVCLQELRSLEDELAQLAITTLRSRHYPDPLGRRTQGTLDCLQQIGQRDIASHTRRTYIPAGTILSVAGKFDWPALQQQAQQLFGDWPGDPAAGVSPKPADGGYHHLDHDSSQTHIAVAFNSVAYGDPDYYQARGAVGVLSDGMSSRLFTEVREKRGLCYAVSASCHSLKGYGSVICYAGTTTERAQQTLDVLTAEVLRLHDGIQADELQRLKARIKSSLIMQQESSSSRSTTMAADWYFLGRVQSLDEVSSIIDHLTVESINAYLASHRPETMTMVTLGEQQLEIPVGVSASNAG